MARFLYHSLLISLLSPLFVLRLLVKSVNESGYRRQWWRRFALGMPSRVRSGDGLIWGSCCLGRRVIGRCAFG